MGVRLEVTYKDDISDPIGDSVKSRIHEFLKIDVDSVRTVDAYNITQIGSTYELTYTISNTNASGSVYVSTSVGNIGLPISQGSHTVRFEADSVEFSIYNPSFGSGDIRFSYMSLKQVFS